MADRVANISKGRVNEFVRRVDGNDPANSVLIVVLYKSAGLEADATLIDHDDLAAVIAGTSDECDFTNYARKTFTDLDLVAPIVDDTNDRQDSDMPDLTWTAAGGALNNTIGKAGTNYDSDSTTGTDSNVIPVTFHDFSVTTDGNNLVLQVPTSGFFGAV